MKDKPLSSLKVKLDVQFTSQQPYFDFDTDMSASALARSMALEPWSRKYFQDLREWVLVYFVILCVVTKVIGWQC